VPYIHEVRNTLSIIGLVLIVSLDASAQKPPRVEFFGGYSYFRVRGSATVQSFLPNANAAPGALLLIPALGLNGWAGAVSLNANKWLGVTADMSGSYGTPARMIGGMPVTIGMHEYNYLAGPCFSLRDGRWRIYAHALAGEAHASVLVGGAEILQPLSVTQTHFTMAFGGGVDLRLHGRFALRLAQADWVRTRFLGGRQENMRIAAGLVFGL
jgi:hypothetical protein